METVAGDQIVAMPVIKEEVLSDSLDVATEIDVIVGCDICGTDDHETDQCRILRTGKQIHDTAAPSRARLTLPSSLAVHDLADGTTTVISKVAIPKSTQFGPFEGRRTNEFNVATRFQLKIFERDGTFLYLDNTEEKDCNWMCLVAMATTEEENNLMAYQLQQDIYFLAKDTINVGQELRVWYAPHYGKRMGIPAPWELGGTKILIIEQKSMKPTEEIETQLDDGPLGKRKRKARFKKYNRGYENNSEPEEGKEQTRREVVQTLDPRRLGFKEIRDWNCSQCGDVFQNCLDFARHLSDHYKPRAPGTKRQEAGKRPKKVSCNLCNQKFTTERTCHRHKLRHHHHSTRRTRKQPESLQDLQPQDRGGLTKELDLITCEPLAGNKEIPANVTEIHIIHRSLPPESKETLSLEGEQMTEVKLDVTQYLANETVIQDIDGEESAMDQDMTEDSRDGYKELTPALTTSSDFENDDEEIRDEGEVDDDQGENDGLLQYECDICHKKFEKSVYLFRHLRKHTGDFMCLQCHKVFARKESLLKHQCTGLTNSKNSGEGYSLTCSYCCKTFINEKLLKRHFAKHTGEYTCPECGKCYASKEVLQNHACSKNTSMEKYDCDVCQKTFTKLKYLDKHIPVHTGVFSCPICGKWLRSNDSLINHMRICGQVKELEANGMATCPHCKEEFDELKAFRRHMYEHNHMFSCDSCGGRFRNKMSLNLHVCNAERDVSCEGCGKQFDSMDSLNRHRVLHGDDEYICKLCNRAYRCKVALDKHTCDKSKEPKDKTKRGSKRKNAKAPSLLPLICEICGSMFSSTSSLNVHKNLHGEKKFTCEECGKKFHRKDLLLEHSAVHGEPEVPCPVCHKLFKTKKSLDVHLLIHDGIKRFKCGQCGKTFYQKGNLQKHEETHTPGRKHMCTFCSKSFCSKEYLNIHVLEHTRGRIFSCQVCGRKFVKEHQLKAHYRIFHSNQAYICKYCNLSVKLRHSLKRHLEKKHNNLKDDWSSNEQIAGMLVKQEGMPSELQGAIITEVVSTEQEVLLAMAGLGGPALQQAIAEGRAQIQPGSVPNTIEISLPVEAEELHQAILPVLDPSLQDAQTIIRHVVADDGTMDIDDDGQLEIAVAQDGEELQQIALMDSDGEHRQIIADADGNIVLGNGTILQPAGTADGNTGDLLFYVLTTEDSNGAQ